MKQHELVQNDKGIMVSNCNIGRAFFRQRLFEQSLDHITASLETAVKLGDKFWEAVILGFIGDIYLESYQLDSAQVYFEQSIALSEAMRNSYAYIFAKSKLAKLFQERNDYEQASAALDLALQYARGMEKRKDMEDLYNRLAALQLKLGYYDEALSYLDTAALLANKVNEQKYLVETYKLYAQLYAKAYDFEKAFEYEEKYAQLNDSLFSIRKCQYRSHFTSRI